jgi:hypothetical protein
MILNRFLIFLFVAVVSAAAQTPGSANSHNAGKAASILSAEGQAAAKHAWDTILIKCGESYYESTGPSSVRQYQHPSFRVISYKLSDADRANGYDWIGDAILTTPLWRNLTRKDDGKWVGEAWQDGTKQGFLKIIHKNSHQTQADVVYVENVARVVAMWKQNRDWQYRLHEKMFVIYFFEMDERGGEPRGWYDDLKVHHDQVDFNSRADTRLVCNSGNIELAESSIPRHELGGKK